jgi:hypothetical protein
MGIGKKLTTGAGNLVHLSRSRNGIFNALPECPSQQKYKAPSKAKTKRNENGINDVQKPGDKP